MAYILKSRDLDSIKDMSPRLLPRGRSRKIILVVSLLLSGFFFISSLSSASLSWSSSHLQNHQMPPLGSFDGMAPTDQIDWSRFAYAQYVTNNDYLCNSLMFFAALQEYGSKAERVMMYPKWMKVKEGDIYGDKLLQAQSKYGVKLSPVDLQHRSVNDQTWSESFTKLLAFNQTNYDRIIYADSDSLLMYHMDELFFLPPAPVAMPLAYWLLPKSRILSSQIMLITPSESEWTRVQDGMTAGKSNDYDMEIMNKVYHDSAMIIPHRPYDMLSSEFRSEDHSWYLSSTEEKWDAVAAFNEAKLIHFSDWPIPKPWITAGETHMKKHSPKCGGMEDCAEKTVWNNLYTEFRKRRFNVCGRND